ncbi:GDSL esterase/lipase At4g28780-like [Gossypium hirsutum]|uniref:GDSL esterase/lipase At4g28780-like n=1 Tax=Gossypium hirsutum TaxID=3635 RepID=A0A1U8L035_GOSHI|nr:GDSL esterase/lipase At4g28780-like [Gossypium hirsutum]
MQNLISLGARKFGIVSVPALGCCPSQRIYQANGECLEELNNQARAFFSTMELLLGNLRLEFKDIKYSLGNMVDMTLNVIDNALAFNFKFVKTACCGSGTLNAQGSCSPISDLCSNRNEYLFWDSFHPTQTASKLAAFTLYGGEPRFVSPINFSQLPDA